MTQSIQNTALPPVLVLNSYTGEAPRNQPAYTISPPSSRETLRHQGDSQLVQSLGPAPFDHPLSGPDSLFNVPPHSTLGLWLKQLDDALRTPDFKQWMKANNISTSNVQFHPGPNTLEVTVDGQAKTFSLDDHSGFAAVAGPLIQAVQALGFWPPSSGRLLDYPSKPYDVASAQDVLRFYGISQADSNALNTTARKQTFAPITDTDPLRGAAALAAQQRVVGDSHDRHHLIAGLARLLAGLPAPPETLLALARGLNSSQISVHPGSSYSQEHHNGMAARASLAQVLQASGRRPPKTSGQLKRLLRDLKAAGPPNPVDLREKSRYAQRLQSMQNALPNVRNEAKKWAEEIIFTLTGRKVDADTVFLNRFYNADSAPTVTGWEHLGTEPLRSQRLPDALLSNFGEQDWTPGVLDQDAGLYTVGTGESKKRGYGVHNQFPLTPSRLMHESWKTDFQELTATRQARFWKDHGDDYRMALKGNFVAQARQQRMAYEKASPAEREKMPPEQRFTHDDYQWVMGAASNLPLKEHRPLTVEQLKATAPVKVSTHVFDINGFQSSDILRFTGHDETYRSVRDRRDGVQILYIPGHQPAFLRFDSLEKMDQWVAEQGKDPDKLKALASHFSLRDRQDNDNGFWTGLKTFFTGDDQSNKGVDRALKYLGSGYWDNLEGTVIDQANVRIQGDVFSAMTDAARKRMTSDTDIAIKSNSEVTRDTWLNDVTAAAGLVTKLAVIGEPVVVGIAAATGLAETALGAEKAYSGDTQAERRQGASAALDGVLNTLFAVAGGTDPVASDPFDLPRERPAVLPLRNEVFSDGQRAQVIDHALTPNAYTLPRTNGYDLVDGDRIYRYRDSRPGELTDLQAQEPAQPLDDFEAICPAPAAGRRVRRGANDECFAKILNDLPEPKAQLQALEHVRLFPSKPSLFSKDRWVIHEKRLHKMLETDIGSQLVPVNDAKRITYKRQVRGKLVADPGFGFYPGNTLGPLAEQTRVVKLNKISEAVDDQRQLRAVVVTSGTQPYLVVEADTAEFYYAPLDKKQTGDITFKKCSPTELDLVQGYRQFLGLNHSTQALDADFIALPKLKGVYPQLEAAGYAKADVDELKQLCKALTDEQQREVVYQLQRAKAITPPDVALRPQQVSALEKPADFARWPAARQNRFYAENAKAQVQQALKATGLGPGNQLRSANDLARADAADMTLNWLRRTADLRAPNGPDLIMKTGAGNCGEMALLSRDIIGKSGGKAAEWRAGDAHAFTVIGGPPGPVSATTDFAGPAWADAWVVDPWADIACPASEYTQQLQATMAKWDAAGLKIRQGGQANMSPLDPDWIDTLVKQPKRPYELSRPRNAKAPAVRPPSLQPAAPVHVAMGESTTLSNNHAPLSTRSLSDCSALAVLSDWNGSTYQTRTLMHLTGSNLELGLRDGNAQQLLDNLLASLNKGGRVILVGGVNTQSTQGLATVIGQTLNGQQPLNALLKERPGVTVTIASSAGITVNADGTFELIEGTGKGVLPPKELRAIFDRID
ncbi:hypothetical protein A7317_12445 [Pseudomonas fluorescens]|uniref:dermonecrotic toxin domain-containing protein n=1 Tax=Pseudomonas fluorescens TaxID=294 RepID=UPI00083DA915|nr:DUF6543 domain-containing protein [Pseudomonas fluorescens]AOE67777.1 hypothetical protein A7317_12445 [Pseudomonas fluorescens]AOE73592.1 hypothetical protein A7319_12430 [Pseudomonas fluorescens]